MKKLDDPLVRHPAQRLRPRLGVGVLLLSGIAGGAAWASTTVPTADRAIASPRHVRTWVSQPGVIYIPGRGTARRLRGGGPGFGK